MKRYVQLIPNLTDWPIYKVFQKRKSILQDVEADLEKYFKNIPTGELDQILAKTIYFEKQRVKSNPFKVDPPNEMQYLRKLQKDYNEFHNTEHAEAKIRESIFKLIRRYTEEIAGNFNINTFLFARKITNHFFYILFFKFGLNSFRSSGFKANRLSDRMKVVGNVEAVRSLMKDHTIILVPTHSSNLDSVLVGYLLDSVCGLPAFSYGAGLNLFDSEFFAFFMNRLGAYKLDRRKKNQIYLQTLNSYSKIIAKKGVHTIFFPGGTRSRSGEVELKLKLGLLSSMISAQRELIMEADSRKIIVVPAVLSYESVLEARSLITQHLKTTGQEKYTARTVQSPIGQYISLIWRILTKESKMCLSIAKPMDVFGNIVDNNGNSLDAHGHKMDIGLYYKREGEYFLDLQRESIYTKELSEKIANQYIKYNYVFPAHLVAFCTFKLYGKLYTGQDIFSMVQMPEEEIILPGQVLENLIAEVLRLLKHKINAGQLIAMECVDMQAKEILLEGSESLGIFHKNKVVKILPGGDVMSEDFITLLYYANKMSIFELDEEIQWENLNLRKN
ncbi:MAG: 1-acyl-sn-glycerol-3-phosphate acyltransferase [Saprospiraceae bacterium]|nr:1-acyl-sn-glycerol-3-phosphate acyltransferase [Saprospiraceae bacterium]